jgi:anaerobic selenocysteine-containing dehydrogenase
MRVLAKGGRIEGVRGDPEHPSSKGYLCPKGAASREVIYSPQRLRHPLLRTSHGFERVSWDEALDRIAEKLLEIKERYGPETALLMRGAPVTEEVWDGFAQLMAT